MKKVLLFNLVIALLFVFKVNAQEKTDKIKTQVSGSIWYQYYYDTYQSVETRDGALYLYPKQLDSARVTESNKIGSSAFFSRFRMKFSGGEAFGAQASGMIEGDFFATAQNLVGHLRLRHAFVKLDWEKSSLLFGQYWHEMVDVDVIPASLLVANVPFFPLNRSPQVNFKYSISNDLSISAAALMQAYHRSSGPQDIQRNAGIPEIAGKIKYKSQKFVFGVNGGIKTLQPRIETNEGAPTSKKISTMYIGAFTKVQTSPVTFKGQLIFGGNLTHFVMIGGMGAQDNVVSEDDFDYTPLRTLSTWGDIYTNNKKVQLGLFLGYSKIYSAPENYNSIAIDEVKLSRDDNLSHVYRVSPRVVFISNKIKLGLEYILTGAAYGKVVSSNLNFEETYDPVINNRILLTAKYDF